MPLLLPSSVKINQNKSEGIGVSFSQWLFHYGGWLGLSLVAVVWVVTQGSVTRKRKPQNTVSKSAVVKLWRPLAKRCASFVDDSIQSTFRELDCLISMRRTLPKADPELETILHQKFRELYSNVQAETDWNMAFQQWQMLYRLSTRLYTSNNEQASKYEIPVYEVNSHHLSLPFWIKEGLRRKVGPLFHLDTHSDMRPIASPEDVIKAVKDLKHNRNVREAWHTIAHTVDDHAMPVAGAILSGFYKNIIWGRPSWTLAPDFLNRNFFFALLEKPFQNQRDKLSASSPKHPTRRHSPQATGQAAWPGLNEDLWEGRYRMYSMNKPKSDNNWGPALLDWRYVPKQHKPLPKSYKHVTPFRWSIMVTDFEVDHRGEGKGKAQFQKLLKAIPKGRFTLDIDLDYFASIDASPKFRREQGKEPEMDEDKHNKLRKILDLRLKRFKNLLRALRNKGRIPALITIADSTRLNYALDPVARSQYEYTPIEYTYFLHQEVRDILVLVYGRKVLPPRKKRVRARAS